MKRMLVGMGFGLVFAVSAWLVPARAADESKLYDQKCANCHGKDGQAQTAAGKSMKVRPWKEDQDLKKMSDGRIKETIRDGVKENGKMRMPANKSLKDDQIDELVKEVRRLSK
jgi:cytochrome c6